ncbi:MAG: DUF1287 domain-containing protein [Candidatus Eremiobacteraeota bacterium]|nr:DUF1287 domain-containing protein [Candidatus Eremiobacteraeota bacterium]
MKRALPALILVLITLSLLQAAELTARQKALLSGARSNLGYAYDSGYYAGGPPPRGHGACTDVLYYALKKVNVDLQDEIARDIARSPSRYPSRRDRNIDYRWCPNLFVWFQRYARSLPVSVNGKALAGWKPGDIVFWSLLRDGVADHCGIISDSRNSRDVPLVIHNFPPECTEDEVLERWVIMGHFRL